MAVYQELETSKDGSNVKLTNHLNTDDIEQANWQGVQSGKGFIRDDHGEITGRLVANIPTEEAAMLEQIKDLDWLSFSRNGDKAAFKRLLQRFPYWKCSAGGV